MYAQINILGFAFKKLLHNVLSKFYLKGRRWPLIASGGFGIGYAYSNCEQELNKSFVTYKIE